MKTTPVTNLKLAAALAAIGVTLVAPKLTRVMAIKHGVAQPIIGFHFDEFALDGVTRTTRLIRAYNNPEEFKDDPGPARLMGWLRAALDNREKLTDKVKATALIAGEEWKHLQDPIECEALLEQAMLKVPSLFMLRRAHGFVLLPENASKEFTQKALSML